MTVPTTRSTPRDWHALPGEPLTGDGPRFLPVSVTVFPAAETERALRRQRHRGG